MRVSLSAEVTEYWRYSEPALRVGECTETTAYEGTQRIRFRTRRPNVVVLGGRPGRVRLRPATLTGIVGTVQAGGTRTVTRECPGGLGDADLFDCAPQRRALKRVTVSISSVRGVVKLRARNLPSSQEQVCAPPPDAADEAGAVLLAAKGRLVERNLFRRPSATARGHFAKKQTLTGDQAGTLTENASWALAFRRVRTR